MRTSPSPLSSRRVAHGPSPDRRAAPGAAPAHSSRLSAPARRPDESGFTFAELAFGLLILVIGAAVLINHLTVNYQTTSLERDRVFAYTKAQAILSEIQGYVDRGLIDAAVDLDVLDDGIVNKSAMTITTDSFGTLVTPDHITSGNYQRNGQWVWSRRITVQPFIGLNNRNVRYVTVRIFRKDREGVDRPMADLSAVINSAGSAFPTTQVFDLYLFAIENIPGWWVFMDSIKPFVESMITDLETRNPGLQFRSHWITKASFGRNQMYRPFTNDSNDTYTASPDVYYYPGRMPSGNASTYYYVPDTMRGRINADGVERNGFSDGATGTNPYPYSFADFFNHAMRYPDEHRLWGQRVQAIEDREQEIADAVAAGTPPPPELDDMSKEPTLRLFLEDLYSNPSKYKNALLINLHGELLPMPALRNYSDAAKEPVGYPDWRVVTHPEQLRTHRDPAGVTSESLEMRMYAYANHPNYTGVDRMSVPMVVEIVGMNLTDPSQPTRLSSSCNLANVPGGVPVPSGPTPGSSNYSTTWQPAKHAGDSPAPATGEMYYTAEFIAATATESAFTRIYLYNTPLIAPGLTQPLGAGTATYGLANGSAAAKKRSHLYGIPYIPSPLGSGGGFTGRDLTSTNSALPKNTARWTLRISPNVFTNGSFVPNVTGDFCMTIRTRIASPGSGGTDWMQSGTMWPSPVQPDNLSVTYAWWTDDREDVPITERSQFNGDPRHMPYRDCFNGTIGTNGMDYPNSYNWYHDDLTLTGETNSLTDYPNIDHTRLRDRWNAAMTMDVPRYFQLLREGITRSAVVYTTLTGYSYYYMGIGQDIGYDSANGYPSSIPSNVLVQGTAGNGYIDTIIGARRWVRDASSGTGYWWGQPWLGELYPDAQQAQWFGANRGNLTPGLANAGANAFYHATCNSIHAGSTGLTTGRQAYGTTMNNFLQRTSSPGCTTMFNIGTSSSTFHHTSSSGNGTLTTVGAELAANYNMTMPSAAPITRPFGLTWGGTTGEHWSFAPYDAKSTGTLYRTYYTHASGVGSGLVKLVNNAGTDAAYVVVNGISNAVDNGTTFISKFAMLSLVHSFFEAGSTTNTLRIPQPARLEITAPTDITELNDPASIDIQYGVTWTRWDGIPYSASGTYSESEALLEYVVMYSNDGGATWLYVQDDTVATPGTRPTDSTYILADAGAGTEVYSWSVPSGSFPEGSYLLRVDCFRQGAQCHYSYHKTKIFIQR